MGIGAFRRPKQECTFKHRETNNLADVLAAPSPVSGRMNAAREFALSGNKTLNPSLMRNLENVFWFGTPRVIERDRTAALGPEREAQKTDAGVEQKRDSSKQKWESAIRPPQLKRSSHKEQSTVNR